MSSSDDIVQRMKNLRGIGAEFEPELREICIALAQAMEELKETGITKRALFLLIQQSAPTVPGSKSGTRKVRLSEIEAVLEGLESLHEFVFGEEDEDDT